MSVIAQAISQMLHPSTEEQEPLAYTRHTVNVRPCADHEMMWSLAVSLTKFHVFQRKGGTLMVVNGEGEEE